MATKKKPTTTGTSIAPPSRRSRNARMVQNFHLVWLDGIIDETNDNCRKLIAKMRQIVNTVNTFIDVDECIEFINGIKEEKAFIISSGAFGQIMVPAVHDKPQVSTICIFCGNKARHEQWAKEWPKIKGVYTDIIPICEALKQTAKDCDHNSVSISFVKSTDGTSKKNLDQLDQSFMYTQILKEILLTIHFEQIHINEFLTYCRNEFADNTIELKNVDMIAKEYRDHQPIWWYTYDCFLYSMLNKALRTMEVDLIIKMGFFVRDLHKHVAALHLEQYGGHHHSNSFTLYRGQGLSQTDFGQLKSTQGGLLAFNNFLSTSHNRDISLEFARRTIATSDLVGVLFTLKIDPSISTTPFANVKNVSYFKGEEEILFSMHSVFRIGQVKQIGGNDRLWQVDLTLTGDNDPQLHALTERILEETFPTTKGWYRLGNLLVQLGQFDKAQQVFDIMLGHTMDQGEKARIHHMLGMVKNNQGKYEEAIAAYQEAIRIYNNIPSTNVLELANSYGNIGGVYDNMGEYSKALSYYEKALEIYQKTLPANHPDLATSYSNIGSVYGNMGKYSKALSHYEKALEIYQKTLPANHPNLATSYNNIGSVYNNMGKYSKALSYYEKALEIFEKTLPAYHPDWATSYNNIGNVYYYMGDYSKALSYFERALDIFQRSLSSNHPSIKTVKKSIEIVKKKL